MRRKRLLPALMLGISCVFSGCIAVPGGEPFGEQTYSEERAKAVYEDIRAEMEQVGFSDWSGYCIEMSENTVSHELYRTEEYTVAWHEGAEDYLWYQGRLYCLEGEELFYRDMEWEELQSDEYAEKQWEFALALLDEEAEELEYKYIPMSSKDQYLLTAEYQETEWDGRTRRFPTLFFRLNEDGDFDGFTLRWQERDWQVIDIGYFPYEDSTDLQAERKVWSFAHELGLIESGVPAISVQQKERERSRSTIEGIDFDSLSERAEYRDDLTFPVLSREEEAGLQE